jgi:REP element-mobilizing transposase RayT
VSSISHHSKRGLTPFCGAEKRGQTLFGGANFARPGPKRGMARQRRRLVENGNYHVTSRGVDRMDIFRDDDDRQAFLDGLKAVVLAREWECLAYCLMDNHFHILVRTPHADISSGMQELKSRYARRFNDKYGRSGPLFDGRFHGELVETDSHLLASARYIDRNPVRAGMCSSPAEWKWSGHADLTGVRTDGFLAVDTLLGLFTGISGEGIDSGRSARERFLEFVYEGVDQPVQLAPRRGRPPKTEASPANARRATPTGSPRVAESIPLSETPSSAGEAQPVRERGPSSHLAANDKARSGDPPPARAARKVKPKRNRRRRRRRR